MHPSLTSLLLTASLAASGCACAAADLQTTTRLLHLPEIGTITNWVLQTSGRSVAFMPPHRWKLQADTRDRGLTWISPQYARISLATDPTSSPSPGIPNDTSILRARASSRVPDSTIVTEQPCYTESEKGIAFDLLWKDSVGQSLRTRLAFIQVAGCNFEFSLTASTDHFAAALSTFTAFLTSFQEVNPQQDKSSGR